MHIERSRAVLCMVIVQADITTHKCAHYTTAGSRREYRQGRQVQVPHPFQQHWVLHVPVANGSWWWCVELEGEPLQQLIVLQHSLAP
jgi:hypothetical protein